MLWGWMKSTSTLALRCGESWRGRPSSGVGGWVGVGGAWVGWCMYGGVGWACPEQGCIVEGETKGWGVQWSGGLWSGL